MVMNAGRIFKMNARFEIKILAFLIIKAKGKKEHVEEMPCDVLSGCGDIRVVTDVKLQPEETFCNTRRFGTTGLHKRNNRIMSLLQAGQKAPSFSAIDQEGKTVTLEEYLGKKVILYFYPKDDTPGCTKEACAFRDNFPNFQRIHAEILGVSVDSEKTHKKFSEKHALPFRLVSDPDKTIVEAYGVWGKKKFMGREYMGTNRVTYLIDEHGVTVQVWPKVKPETHAAEVLEWLQQKT